VNGVGGERLMFDALGQVFTMSQDFANPFAVTTGLAEPAQRGLVVRLRK
jgi:hypothetical protein